MIYLVQGYKEDAVRTQIKLLTGGYAHIFKSYRDCLELLEDSFKGQDVIVKIDSGMSFNEYMSKDEFEEKLFGMFGHGGICPIEITHEGFKKCKKSFIKYKKVPIEEFSHETIGTEWVTGFLGNPPSDNTTHNYGEAEFVAKMGEIPLTYSLYDIARSTLLGVYVRASPSGAINFFGGLTDKNVEHLDAIIEANPKLCFFGSTSEYKTVTQKRAKNEKVFKLLGEDRLLAWQRMLSENEVKFDGIPAHKKFLTISDSHGFANCNDGTILERNDGRTLRNFVNSDDSPEGYHEVTLSFGNIDIQHHVNRHPIDTWVKLVNGYVDKAIELAKNNTDVLIATPLPIFPDSRKMPKTMHFKGEPYYGTRDERLNALKLFKDIVDSRIKTVSNVHRLSLTQDHYDMDPESFAEECMERKASVHLRSCMYRRNNPKAYEILEK